MRRSSRRRIIGMGLVAIGALALSGGATARETMLETLSATRKFAPVWPGGTAEQGSSSGMPWLRVVTDGAAGGTFVANVHSYQPVLDLTGKYLKTWIKIDEMDKLGGLEVRLSSDRFAKNYYAFSFEIFDDEDFNVVRDAVWTPLTFDFAWARVEGKPDRSAINSIGLYVSDKGNEAPVTAYWGGLAAIDEPTEGILSFTFDDGYDEHTMAAQLMQPYGFRGTAYVIPDSIGAFGYMTLHQLVDLKETYHWEVAAHYATPFTEMSPDELEDTLLGIQRFLEENGFEEGARHLAYPLGKQDTALVRPLVRKHFTTARVASAGPETLPPADPHLLRAINVTTDTTPAEIGAAARRAKANKEWLILMLHWLVEKPEYDTQYSIPNFKKMLAEVKKSGIRVVPLAEAWRACERWSGPGGCDVGSRVAAPASN